MARLRGTKNIMWTAEQKETIVLEYLKNNVGQKIKLSELENYIKTMAIN